MMNSSVEVESVLAIEIGATNTRALLFDIAGDSYRFIAAGQAATTIDAPHQDLNVGAVQAIENLQDITGRTFFDENQLIMPTRLDGVGVDLVVSTISAGPTMNLAVVGLLDDVSLASARHLAATTYGQIVEHLSLSDHRPRDVKIDTLIRANPDVVIIAGGTDGGSSHSLDDLVEVVGLACYLVPPEKRPAVLYAGNKDLAEKVRTNLEGIVKVETTANIRPVHNREDLSPARRCLAETVDRQRIQRVSGLQAFSTLTGRPAMSAAYAFGRIIRFLSKANQSSKAALGIDLGAETTTLAAGYGGQLELRVTDLGIGSRITGLLDRGPLQEITRWLPMHLSDDTVRDYLHHKALYPGSVPVTQEDLAIEQAAARQIMRAAMSQFSLNFTAQEGNILCYEPILAAGAVLTQAPSLGQSMLMLLDGIQPVGISTIVLDQNHLTPALGAIAESCSILPVHVFESDACLYLGTVISPVSSSRYGATILNARLLRSDGSETEIEVKQGSFHVLELERGQNAELYLEMFGDVDLGLGKSGRGVKIIGGALGAVIDARGRPLSLPTDDSRRREMIKKWIWTLGG